VVAKKPPRRAKKAPAKKVACTHPKEKLRYLGYGKICECGKFVK
jgi:hypothetical protein